MSKVPLLIGLVSFVVFRLVWYFSDNIWLSLLVFSIPVALLVTGVLLRKRLKNSKWFLSPLNLSLERVVRKTRSEISADLLYEKLLEVIADSEFKLFDADQKERRILIGTTANFWTWGENIYIQLEPEGSETVINVSSVTVFGNSSWKRNESNFHSLIQSFESSLTI